MSLTGTQAHNEICNWFLDEYNSLTFIRKYIDKDFDYIDENSDSKPFVEVERIVSTGKHLIGYIDAFIDFKSKDGQRHSVAIEVKSSEGVISRDTNEIIRQMKKYKFYDPKITDMFLVYGGYDKFGCVPPFTFAKIRPIFKCP
ncbi:MAG: hypothetical protein ACQETR_14020 [Thermodesulfobacteriota bacterium]